MDIQKAKSLIKEFGLTQLAVSRQMGIWTPRSSFIYFAGRQQVRANLTLATMIAAIYQSSTKGRGLADECQRERRYSVGDSS